MSKPLVKYLSPTTGKYEYATVVDIGDLSLLKTNIKTNIVDAINSLYLDGTLTNESETEMLERDRQRLTILEGSLNELKNGNFTIENWESVDNYFRDKLGSFTKEDSDGNVVLQLPPSMVKDMMDDIVNQYQNELTNQNLDLKTLISNINDIKKRAEATARELENAKPGYDSMTRKVDEMNKVIEDKISTVDFDYLNAMTKDYSSAVRQSSESFNVDTSGKMLSFISGKVKDLNSELLVQSDKIESKVSYDDYQYLPMQVTEGNENLLHFTLDLSKEWTRNNANINVLQEQFRHTQIVELSHSGSYYEQSTYDDLIQGGTYTASVWANVQPRDKTNPDNRFAPTPGAAPHDVDLVIGSDVHRMQLGEDLTSLNGWGMYYYTFVAEEPKKPLHFNLRFDTASQVGYITGMKLEKGTKPTEWSPHRNDNYATLASSISLIRQQGDSVTIMADKVSQYGKDISNNEQAVGNLERNLEHANTSLGIKPDGSSLITKVINELGGEVTTEESGIKTLKDGTIIEASRKQFDKNISDVNIDSRNKILNSSFSLRTLDETTGKYTIDKWGGKDGLAVLSTGENGTQESFLLLKQSGLSNINVLARQSTKFAVNDKQRLIFTFNAKHNGIDMDNIFEIEVFDKSDISLFKQDFKLSELDYVDLNNGIKKYAGSYHINQLNAAKARVNIKLPKNGELYINKISVSSADIKSTDWVPAPEDAYIIEAKNESKFEVLNGEINARVRKDKIDTSNGLVYSDSSGLSLNPDKIISTVTSSSLGDRALISKTNFEQSANGWLQTIEENGKIIDSINASPGLYQINFDKVAIDGELLAKKVSAYDLDVGNGLKIINSKSGSSLPVLYANAQTGEVELNVSKLKIGSSMAATKKDIEEIELMPGPKGEPGEPGQPGKSSYTHIAYLSESDIHIDDPHLDKGQGEIGVYNNAKDDSVEISHIYDESGDGMIKVSHVRDGGAPNRGGFVNTFFGAAEGVYLVEFEAKIPEGARLIRHNNSLGDGASVVWLTGIEGTGDWERYAYVTHYGTGSISAMGYISILYDEPVFDWYVSYYQRYDITNAFDVNGEVNAKYMGVMTSESEVASKDVKDYRWSVIKGEKGEVGIDGKDGQDGESSFTYIAYADSSNGYQGFSFSNSNNKYIGQYVRYKHKNISAEYQKTFNNRDKFADIKTISNMEPGKYYTISFSLEFIPMDLSQSVRSGDIIDSNIGPDKSSIGEWSVDGMIYEGNDKEE